MAANLQPDTRTLATQQALDSAPNPASDPAINAGLHPQHTAVLQLEAAGQQFTSEHWYWLSGYAAGRAAGINSGALNPTQAQTQSQLQTAAREATAENQLHILYGSQTGNSQELAERYAEAMRNGGVTVQLHNTLDFKLKTLGKIHNLLVVISTHGDGEPPDDALDFMEQLHSKKAPKLAHLHYAVLALGDSTYPDFCTTGRQVDTRLAELGAQRWSDCATADVDIEAVAAPWWEELSPRLLETLSENTDSSAPTHSANAGASITPIRRVLENQYTRNNPYAAELLTNQRITADSSDKDVRHIELDLGDSGLQYEPGDSLGVYPINPQQQVASILQATGLDGDAVVDAATDGNQELPLHSVLREQREISLLSRPFLQAHLQRIKSAADRDELQHLLHDDQRQSLSSLFKTHQIVDVLRRWPATWNAAEFANELRPLAPRLYSIASSQLAHEDEVHTTVARVDYRAYDYQHVGSASCYLADLDAEASQPVSVFIDRNPRFRLPADPNTPIIMVGPGTGIAPFRAFVQHRAEQDGNGKNWLFFGAQHFRSQFLYQTEWQQALRKGQLERLDLAFSRDQANKIYVQHRLLEQAKDVYAWLQDGAHFYVCGDAEYMAKDVHTALHSIIKQQGKHTDEQAEDYLRQLKREHRYLQDVY